MKKQCEVCGVLTTSKAIIRTFNVCQKCFSKLRKDNFKRQNKKQDITNSILTYEDEKYQKQCGAKKNDM